MSSHNKLVIENSPSQAKPSCPVTCFWPSRKHPSPLHIHPGASFPLHIHPGASFPLPKQRNRKCCLGLGSAYISAFSGTKGEWWRFGEGDYGWHASGMCAIVGEAQLAEVVVCMRLEIAGRAVNKPSLRYQRQVFEKSLWRKGTRPVSLLD